MTPDQKRYLETGDHGHKIRHEIYENLVYPVLLDGYLRRDASSILWLAKTTQNLHQVQFVHPLLRNKGEIDLLDESYKLKPNEEIRLRLLDFWLKCFGYSQHEWPIGILYGMNGANKEQCEEILQEIESVRVLDTQNKYGNCLTDYENKVREYLVRLQNCD